MSQIQIVDDVDISIAPGPWAFAQDKQAMIEARWFEFSNGNTALYNGRVYVTLRHSIEITGSKLRCHVVETDFKSFLYWRDCPENHDSVSLFGSSILMSRDGAILTGKMAPHTANAGQVYFPAGSLDPDDVVGDKVKIEVNLARELFEETGLQLDQAIAQPPYLVSAAGPHVSIAKFLKIDLTFFELAERLKPILDAPDAEFSQIFPMSSLADLKGHEIPDYAKGLLTFLFSDAGTAFRQAQVTTIV